MQFSVEFTAMARADISRKSNSAGTDAEIGGARSSARSIDGNRIVVEHAGGLGVGVATDRLSGG